MTDSLLQLNNISVAIQSKEILHDVNMTIRPGTIQALMGPNGSGKSSLAYAIMGHPLYSINKGNIIFSGDDITDMPPVQRAQKGLFLAFQQPIDIPGVSVYSLLKEAYRVRVGTDFSLTSFDKCIIGSAKKLSLELDQLQRPLQGFSGGQKKKLELLQLLVLQPSKLAILDELDAGLDVEALALVASCICAMRVQYPAMSFLVISHQPRFFEYLKPDVVYCMKQGSIMVSEDSSLIDRINREGYDAIFP